MSNLSLFCKPSYNYHHQYAPSELSLKRDVQPPYKLYPLVQYQSFVTLRRGLNEYPLAPIIGFVTMDLISSPDATWRDTAGISSSYTSYLSFMVRRLYGGCVGTHHAAKLHIMY